MRWGGIHLTFFLLLLIHSSQSHGTTCFGDLVKRADTTSDSAFLNTFDYQGFREALHPELLEVDTYRRELLNDSLPGNDWAYEVLGPQRWHQTPGHIQGIASVIKAGEDLFFYNALGFAHDTWVYEAAADYLMTQTSKMIKKNIENGEWKKDDLPVALAMLRLAENGYLINLPTSKWVKLKTNVLAGNWSYIITRFFAELHTNLILQVSTLVMTLLISWACIKQTKLLIQRWNS